MKNGIIIDGKVYELVKSDDFNCCKNCDLRKDCEISKVKGPCRSFEKHEDKHFKLGKMSNDSGRDNSID